MAAFVSGGLGGGWAARVEPARRGVCAARPRRVVPRALVVDVTSPGELTTALENAGDSLVVVDYSTTWCGPCKVIAPKFEEFSEAYADVVFLKVMGDVGEGVDIMKEQGIRAVPAFHFWKSNERVDEFTGARTDELEAKIKSLS
mmetsp:Transcript_40816/g.100438  ORF Transcript_40816/g.100438 Transcript_40816/m.100438 type:complete len:144 (+) Transcript_40816:2-433(+)